MRRVNDIMGKTFDQFTVIERDNTRSKSGEVLWLLRCACGEQCKATSSELNRGRRGFCGTCRDSTSIKSPLKSLYNNYKKGAEKRGLSFSLSIEDVQSMISRNCQYCNTPPMQVFKKKGSRKGMTYNGIDRIDKTRGYEMGNCCPCCKFCNYAKMKFPVKEFDEWMNRVATYKSSLFEKNNSKRFVL